MPLKPLGFLTDDELDAVIERLQEKERSLLRQVFGGQAERYARLLRTANHPYDFDRAKRASEQIRSMEDTLSREQLDLLFGFGEPDDYDLEEAIYQRRCRQHAAVRNRL